MARQFASNGSACKTFYARHVSRKYIHVKDFNNVACLDFAAILLIVLASQSRGLMDNTDIFMVITIVACCSYVDLFLQDLIPVWGT